MSSHSDDIAPSAAAPSKRTTTPLNEFVAQHFVDNSGWNSISGASSLNFSDFLTDDTIDPRTPAKLPTLTTDDEGPRSFSLSSNSYRPSATSSNGLFKASEITGRSTEMSNVVGSQRNQQQKQQHVQQHRPRTEQQPTTAIKVPSAAVAAAAPSIRVTQHGSQSLAPGAVFPSTKDILGTSFTRDVREWSKQLKLPNIHDMVQDHGRDGLERQATTTNLSFASGFWDAVRTQKNLSIGANDASRFSGSKQRNSCDTGESFESHVSWIILVCFCIASFTFVCLRWTSLWIKRSNVGWMNLAAYQISRMERRHLLRSHATQNSPKNRIYHQRKHTSKLLLFLNLFYIRSSIPTISIYCLAVFPSVNSFRHVRKIFVK